jgi:hypothetical protein
MNLRVIAPVLTFLVVGGCVSLGPAPTPSSPSATPPATAAANATPTATPIDNPSLPPGVTARPRASLPFDVATILTASLSVANFSDEAITVKVAALDPDSHEVLEVEDLTLQPFETISQETFPAQYRIGFQRATSSTSQVCLLDLKEGESYSFVGLVTRVAVTLSGTDPASTADLVLETSALCHAWSESP